MTKKEAIEFLTNTKVYVKDKSEQIQLKLFSLGFKWELSSESVQYTNAPFIYINEKYLTYGTNVENFYSKEYREITPEDILKITIESKYRPFKDQKELWKEMFNHQPFGWIRHKDTLDYMILTTCVYVSVTFKDIFRTYTFADGTPFGIKED